MNIRCRMQYLKSVFCLLGIAAFYSCSLYSRSAYSKDNPSNGLSSSSEVWPFEKVSGDILKFKGAREYDTDVFDLQYIGQIENGQKAPFLIFSGRSCQGCDESISIYIHSPANGKLAVELGQNRYQYPGIERDHETNEVLYKARAFYGQVLPAVKGVIWYQEQLLENESRRKSVFIAEVAGGSSQDQVIADSGQLKTTLALCKRGLCTEIKGIKYTSEP